eukprot:230276-Rhodomonas_salina.4
MSHAHTSAKGSTAHSILSSTALVPLGSAVPDSRWPEGSWYKARFSQYTWSTIRDLSTAHRIRRVGM